MLKINPGRIIISRVDNIGDVILTLPIAVYLKQEFPQAKILFLGRDYARPVIEACGAVDEYISADEIFKNANNNVQFFRDINADIIIHVFPDKKIARLAKKAGIPIRIGTSHRIYHWWTCSKLVHLGRKNSNLHESQLNLKLLFPILNKPVLQKSDIDKMKILDKVKPLGKNLKSLLEKNKLNLILHPKSRGSAREWGFDNFNKLIGILPKKYYNIFITGTKEESPFCQKLSGGNPHVHDLSGKMTLDELISFIKECDALVAASTGPLHIAAATGIHAIGIYAPMRPMHPERWGPVGPNAGFLVVSKNCSDCRRTGQCHCIVEISPEMVMKRLEEIRQKKAH